jgi:hypothetical protein
MDRETGRTKRPSPRLGEAFAADLAAATLTDRQRRFVAAFIARPVGAAAARAAGYSPRRDRQQAYDNLRKPPIRRLIEQALDIEYACILAALTSPDTGRAPRRLRYKG